MFEVSMVGLQHMSPCPYTYDIKQRLQEVSEMTVKKLTEQLQLNCESRCCAGFINLEMINIGNHPHKEMFQSYALIAEKAQKIINQEITKNKIAPSLMLDMISDQTSSNASHITIAISGFLSQETNKTTHWRGLVKHFKGHSQTGVFDTNTTVYGLTWEAYTKTDLYKEVAKTITAAAFNGFLTLAAGPVEGVGLAILGAQSAMEITRIHELFQTAKQQAKTAGKLLACMLALRMPFTYQTVSFVAFSLGTQVVKSCIKTLHKIYSGLSLNLNQSPLYPHCEIVQNVTLLGGATHFSH